MVVKPGRGAGCDGVRLARNQRELRAAIEGLTGRGGRSCRTQTADDGVLVQQYIRGMAASVSLISNGRRVVPLSINAQTIRRGRAFSYRGGCTPLDHPLAARGIAAAIRACETLRNLRGYIGVDLVLTGTDAVVIEVNPRLTTAYLGVRAAVRRSNGAGNIAGLAIEACEGAVPARPVMQHRVRFTSAGRIAMSS
jgi:predicted ATP-grasp superfamily ATP-dependent carboligase